jgi:hypothetical protein
MTHKNYKIVNKYGIQNYIKFELDGYVEFNDGKQRFIYYVNEYPFINYQTGDEIEVNLSNAKRMSSSNYHQQIVKKVSKNYTVGYCSNYNLLQDEQENEDNNEGSKPLQISAQEQITLHQVKLALDSFYNVLEPLEEYVKKAGYYPNFRSKRQLYRRVIQDSEGTLENDKNLFLTDLYIFSGAAEDEVGIIKEVLKQDFYG